MNDTHKVFLCYGFLLTDKKVLKKLKTADLESFILELFGLVYSDKSEKTRQDYFKRRPKLLSKIGVTLITCSKERYILAAKQSIVELEFEYSKSYIKKLGQPTPHKNWREKIQNFCKKAGINFIEPQFLLSLYYKQGYPYRGY